MLVRVVFVFKPIKVPRLGSSFQQCSKSTAKHALFEQRCCIIANRAVFLSVSAHAVRKEALHYLRPWIGVHW